MGPDLERVTGVRCLNGSKKLTGDGGIMFEGMSLFEPGKGGVNALN